LGSASRRRIPFDAERLGGVIKHYYRKAA
jgi:hypothetical protein